MASKIADTIAAAKNGENSMSKETRYSFTDWYTQYAAMKKEVTPTPWAHLPENSASSVRPGSVTLSK